MGRFCDQLGLSGHVADAAARIVRAAAEQEIGVGRDPSTMAGAAIFMAAQLHPDDKRVTLEQIGARRAGLPRAHVCVCVSAPIAESPPPQPLSRARLRARCGRCFGCCTPSGEGWGAPAHAVSRRAR